MKAGGGKQKGAQFERDACRRLSLWISTGKRKDIFWRSAMSGGRATVGLKQGDQLSAQAGDISLVDPLGASFINTFVVECKFYKDLKVQNLIFEGKSGLLEFWQQVNRDAVSHKKLPFLIAKQNNYREILCLNNAGFGKLLSRRYHKPNVIVPTHEMNIFLFDYVLKHANPEHL